MHIVAIDGTVITRKTKEKIMAKKSKFIPFSFLPASWGLKGEAYQRAKIEYELDGIDRKIALAKVGCKTTEEEAIAEADVMLEEGEMTQAQHDKAVAHVLKRPWVEVKKMEVNPDDPKAGYMELDWNDEFVAMLQDKGYVGDSDESVVNKWFNGICRTVLLQELEDQDYGLEQQYDGNDVVSVTEPEVSKEEPNE